MLNVSNNGITAEGTQWIAQTLQVNNRLAENDLSANEPVMTSEFIRTNLTLIEFNMSSNCITDKGIVWLTDTLCTNNTL